MTSADISSSQSYFGRIQILVTDRSELSDHIYSQRKMAKIANTAPRATTHQGAALVPAFKESPSSEQPLEAVTAVGLINTMRFVANGT